MPHTKPYGYAVMAAGLFSLLYGWCNLMPRKNQSTQDLLNNELNCIPQTGFSPSCLAKLGNDSPATALSSKITQKYDYLHKRIRYNGFIWLAVGVVLVALSLPLVGVSPGSRRAPQSSQRLY